MSPDQGGRKASGKGGGKGVPGPVAARRRALLLFGVAFVALFTIVAIGEGLGEPSIPSGDIILVEDAVGDSGKISQADFDHALEVSAAQAGQQKVPKPDDPKYEELKEAAVSSLIEFAWLEGQASEMGIEVTDAEIAKELEKIKKESFQSEAEFDNFAKKAKFTQEDIDTRVKLQIINTKIQEQLQAEPPEPSQGEIEDYYEAGKSTQFAKPASSDVRIVQNKDRKEAERALAELEKDNTSKSWNKVAKKYSESTATKDKGGLQKEVTTGSFEEPLVGEITEAPEGELEGPVKTGQGFYIFEVQRHTPESTEPLKAVESQVESQLVQRAEQEALSALAFDFNTKWRARTFCVEGYETESCENFKSSGRPASAPPACYEADPDGGRPEACPAPVFQLVPAMPGSITPLEPQGNPLAQRPVPVATGGGEAQPPTGLPEGTVPPPSE